MIPTTDQPETGVDEDCDGTVDNIRLIKARSDWQWPPAVAYRTSTTCCDWILAAWSDSTTGLVTTELLLANGHQTFQPETVSTSAAVDSPALPQELPSPLVVWATADGVELRVLTDVGFVVPEQPVVTVTNTPGVYRSPKIAKNSHNFSDYLITWVRDGTLFGRIVKLSRFGGDPANNYVVRFPDAEFQISPTGGAVSGDVLFDYLVPNAVGQYFAVWDGPGGVQGRFASTAGVPGQTVQIAPAGSKDSWPSVALGPEMSTGEIFVVWSRGISSTEVVAQRVNADGTLAGGPLTIDEGNLIVSRPDVSFSLALGQYLVTWGRKEASGTLHPVARRVNVDGTIPLGRFVIDDNATGDPSGGAPVTAAVESGGPLQNAGSALGGALIYGHAVLYRNNKAVGGNLSYDVIDRHLDSDGDALLDEWELNAVDVNNDGQIDPVNDLDLTALDPANPPHFLRKDVYLEIDWMDCAEGGCAAGDTHNHKFRDLNNDGVPEVAQVMIDAFGKDQSPATVHNADPNYNGIQLHIDYGQMGGGTGVLHTSDIPAGARRSGMDPRRRRVFHYGLASHLCCGAADLPGSFFWAGRGGDERTLDDARRIAANTFMHELGHTLGLQHGGRDSDNFKPNFLSIMNYAFAGSIPTITGPSILDYSRLALPDLDENGLDEAAGLGGDPAGNVLTMFTCPPDANQSLRGASAALSGPVDWNCNTATDPDLQKVSIDGSYIRDAKGKFVLDANGQPQPTLKELAGADDWSHLFYNFRVVGNYGASAQSLPPEDLPTIEEVHENLPKPGMIVRLTEQFPPKTDHYSIETFVMNDGPGIAKSVVVTVTVRGESQTFELGTMQPGNSDKRILPFKIPPPCRSASTLVAEVKFLDLLNGPLPPVRATTLATYCEGPGKKRKPPK